MACPTPSYVDTVEANIQGIKLLQQQQNAEAIEFFCKGLRIIRPTLVAKSAASSLAASPFANVTDLPYLNDDSEFPRRRKTLVSVALTDQDKAISAHDDFFAIYNRALHFSHGDIPLAGVPKVYGRILSAVLIYNLGLAHHLEALKIGDSISPIQTLLSLSKPLT